MSSTEPTGRERDVLLVGVAAYRSGPVIAEAVSLAVDLGAELLFAHVGVGSALIEWERGDRRNELSLNPHVDDELAATAATLSAEISGLVGDADVPWVLQLIGGDPAKALTRLAREQQPRLVIVGGPRPGLSHRIEDALSGSVPVGLARNQARPVVVVPIGRGGAAA